MMSPTKKIWVITILLGLLLTVSLWWGSGQYRLRRSFTVQLENNYQRAFHELVWSMKTVENELALLSAAGGSEQQVQSLATVWRQVYAAHEKVGQLPLGLVPLDATEAYLTEAGDYIFALVTRGSQLTTAERDKIAVLQQSAGQISNELASLQSTILKQDIRWTDVQAALVAAERGNEVQDNTVVDGLQLVNRKVQEFPEVSFDQRIGVVQPPPTALGSEQVTQAAAEQTARWFLSPNGQTEYQAASVELTSGTIPTYRFVFTTAAGDQNVTVEVTQQGGKVFWMLDNRVPSGTGTLPSSALTEQATEWLRRRGYTGLRLIGQHDYQGSMLFAYAYEQNGVLIYPDLLRLRVASDDGSVIGFEGNGYVAYHVAERQLPSPRITVEQALGKLAAGLQQNGPVQLALIFNASAAEALVYEIPVSRGEDSFLVYVDARQGDEIQIVRLDAVSLPSQAASGIR